MKAPRRLKEFQAMVGFNGFGVWGTSTSSELGVPFGGPYREDSNIWVSIFWESTNSFHGTFRTEGAFNWGCTFPKGPRTQIIGALGIL